MQFSPKTQEDIDRERILPDGIYDATVKSAEDKQSQAGNDMIKVVLTVYADDGTERTITDYLMEKMAGKLLHFATAAGLGEEYNAGTLDADQCAGRDVRVKLGEEIDKTGQYPPKNRVVDYVAQQARAPQRQAAAPAAKPSNGNGAPSIQQMRTASMRKAWTAFQASTPTDTEAKWKAALAAYFPGKTKDQISTNEWDLFASDKFKRPVFDPAEIPIGAGGGPGIPEDEIPFAPPIY